MLRLLIAILLVSGSFSGLSPQAAASRQNQQSDQQPQAPYVVPPSSPDTTSPQPAQPAQPAQPSQQPQVPYVIPSSPDSQTVAQPTQPAEPAPPSPSPDQTPPQATQPSQQPQAPAAVTPPVSTPEIQTVPQQTQSAEPSRPVEPAQSNPPSSKPDKETSQQQVQNATPVSSPSDTEGASQPAQPSEPTHPKSAKAETAKHKKKSVPAVTSGPVIWTDPGNISKRDLFYGQGGKDHQPKPPFVFLDEDKSGTNPKFDLQDADGKKWRVKLGAEARPEVVASRLLWAVGFFANDDYFVAQASAPGIELSRGQNLISHHSDFENARFARRPKQEKKIGIWHWKRNPLVNTREFNGLRVMMAVMNGWDLKDENNAIYEDEKTGRQIYLASDVGATFGTNGLSLTHARSKGNVNSFKNSKFITKVNDGVVDFATPAKPVAPLITSFGIRTKEFVERSGYQWIGRNIPLQDARWMASLLGKLSHQQLTDAFRAGGFSDDKVDEFVAIVEARIGELKAL